MAERKQAPSREARDKLVTAVVESEPIFAIGEIENFGVKQRGYINAPPDLRVLLAMAMENADKTAVVFEDQRWTYGERSPSTLTAISRFSIPPVRPARPRARC